MPIGVLECGPGARHWTGSVQCAGSRPRHAKCNWEPCECRCHEGKEAAVEEPTEDKT